MVESANKLVVEDRLKGAGMHWAEANVNPMLALRNAVCNDRWEESWTVIEREQRGQSGRSAAGTLPNAGGDPGGGGTSSTSGSDERRCAGACDRSSRR